LNVLLGAFTDLLEGKLFGQKLPLIGDALKNNAAASFLRDIRQPLIDGLTNASMGGKIAETAAKTTVFNVLGPSGLNMLGDRNGDRKVSVEDVGLTTATGSNGFAQFDFRLFGQKIINLPIAVDFGFPFLGLTINPGSTFQLVLAYDMNFGFGISRTEGFYFNT